MKKTSPSSTFHLYLSVDNHFAKKVSDLSKKIFKHYSSNFVVGENYVPHFTLYLFSAPIRNSKKIIAVVEKMFDKLISVKCTGDKLELGYDGWLMTSVKEKSYFLKLHKLAVANINSLREGCLRKKYRQQSDISLFPKEEKSSLLKYGDRHAMKLFHPHISVAEITDQNKAQEAFEEYKNIFVGTKITTTTLELIQEYDEGTGGIGKTLFKKSLF